MLNKLQNLRIIKTLKGLLQKLLAMKLYQKIIILVLIFSVFLIFFTPLFSLGYGFIMLIAGWFIGHIHCEVDGMANNCPAWENITPTQISYMYTKSYMIWHLRQFGSDYKGNKTQVAEKFRQSKLKELIR